MRRVLLPLIILLLLLGVALPFSAAAQACFASGAKDVSILALARVAKDD